MKKITLFFLSYILCAPIDATSLKHSVDNIINNVDPSINMSISVVDLNTGEHLYERNASRALIPASNMKLFSEAAALMALGPDYRFQRQLSTDAKTLDNGILNGSIYLTLPGDPSFTSKSLAELLSFLTPWGIQEITGNVVLVNKNASVDPYPPGRDPRDKTKSYGAPITPIILDENSLTFIVNPGSQANEPASVEVNAPNGVITVNNSVKTSAKQNLSAIGYKLDMDNHLTTTGAIGTGTWAMETKIAIQNPLLYAQDFIKAQLTEKQIKLDGNVVPGNLPANTVILGSQTSEPLKQLMADTLKPSDNVFADSLFIHTASQIFGSPVNWVQANTITKQFLQQQTGVNLTDAILMDGSGLSKQDRVTAEQTVELLSHIYTHFPITYEFIAALPIAGYDGTLQKRFNNTSQQGLVRAKTGTMTGILSLSGYLSAANGHTLAFAMYINRSPKTPPNVSGRYRSLIDQLCGYFLQQKPGGIRAFFSKKPQAHVAFQQNPSQANKQRSKQAQWRGLEMSLRNELKNNRVAVLYKQDELVLKDNNSDANSVWNTLDKISKKYPFSVALKSQSAPQQSNSSLSLLWIKSAEQTPEPTRTWVLRKNQG